MRQPAAEKEAIRAAKREEKYRRQLAMVRKRWPKLVEAFERPEVEFWATRRGIGGSAGNELGTVALALIVIVLCFVFAPLAILFIVVSAFLRRSGKTQRRFGLLPLPITIRTGSEEHLRELALTPLQGADFVDMEAMRALCQSKRDWYWIPGMALWMGIPLTVFFILWPFPSIERLPALEGAARMGAAIFF